MCCWPSQAAIWIHAVGLDKPDIGILDEAFLAEVRNLPERNLAVELLERLLEGEIRSRFHDALADNESAVRELSDQTLKKIAQELTENLRKNLSVDWSARESVRARLHLMVKRILRKYRYPPDLQEGAVELVLQQAKALGMAWMAA
jgi:type I site-specific restriction-modification system R (restriction) subunit